MTTSNAKKNSLYLHQLFYVTVNIQIGFSALRIAYTTGKYAGHDGWLSVIGGGLLSQALILLIWLVMRLYPRQDLFQIAMKLLGPVLGRFVILVCALYFCLLVLYTIAELSRLIHIWVLPLTPQWALLIIPIFCLGYMTVEPARVLARCMTLCSIFLLYPLIIAIFPITAGNWLNLFPIGEAGAARIFNGVKEAFTGFLGFEAMFVMYALTRGSSLQKLGVISMANGFVLFYYVYLSVTSVIAFGNEESKLVPEPVLYMMKAVSFKIFERPDLLFFATWFIIVLVTIAGYLFLASSAVHRLAGIKRKPVILVLCVVFYVLGLLTTNVEYIKAITDYLEIASYIVTGGIPLLLLIVAAFRKKTRVKTV